MRNPRHPAMPVFLALCWLLAVPAIGSAPQAHNPDENIPPVGPSSVTVPFSLDHNRMIVEVEFPRPDGTVRKAAAWVDTGNEGLILTQPLAAELNLDTHALDESPTGHSVDSASPAPPLRLGGMPLDATGVRLRIHPGSRVMPGVPAEVHLPATVLRRLHVVFDYPAMRLTVARPGVRKPMGVPVPCRINPDTGLFLVEASCDGQTVALGVDNGSAGTWVSDRLTTSWQGRHPDWPHAVGAVGSANFFGFPFEAAGTLMRLPELEIGLKPGSRQKPGIEHDGNESSRIGTTAGEKQSILLVKDVGLLGLDQRMFDWYSRKSAGPVDGFIGANVLVGFRLEIDFPNCMTYWEPASPAGPPQQHTGASSTPGDFDLPGLTLRPEADGGYTIAGIVGKDGQPTIDDVQAGDRLLRVDALDTTGVTMGTVIDALRGTPGTPHTLLLERAGRRLEVTVWVRRFP